MSSSAGIISFLSSDFGEKTVSWQNLFLLLVLVSIKALIRTYSFFFFNFRNKLLNDVSFCSVYK